MQFNFLLDDPGGTRRFHGTPAENHCIGLSRHETVHTVAVLLCWESEMFFLTVEMFVCCCWSDWQRTQVDDNCQQKCRTSSDSRH